jgi:type IV pilus assembly protein PilM
VRRVVGLHTLGVFVGDGVARAVHVEGGRRRWRVVATASEPVAPGAVAQGEVADVGALSQTLRRLAIRTEFARGRAVAALDGRAVAIHTGALPLVPRARLESTVRLNLDRYLPIPREEAVVQVLPLPKTFGRQAFVVIGCRRQVSEGYVAAFAQAGLTLHALDAEPAARQRALAALGRLPGGTFLALDLTTEPASLAVYHEGLVPTLYRSLGPQRLDELVRSLQFYRLQHREGRIGTAVLLAPPGEPHLDDLIGALRQEGIAEVVAPRLLLGEAGADAELPAEAAVAFGAALRGVEP